MSSILIDNQKVSGGIISNAGNNTSTWYTRLSYSDFEVNGAFNPLQGIFDWVLTKTTDSQYIKSDIIRFKAPRQSIRVSFKSVFPDSNYFVFFSSNSNVNLYWSDKKRNGFVINSSSPFQSEVTWLAIHKSFAILTGVNSPGTMYTGTRNLVYDTVACTDFLPGGNTDPVCINQDLDITQDCNANLQGWFANQYIIKPTVFSDGINIPMNFSNNLYSILTTTNTNINTFWIEKANDRAKVGTSFPIKCTMDYLFIQNGYQWWNNLP